MLFLTPAETATFGPGKQTIEAKNWVSGEGATYQIPAGVTVRAVQYRETGFDCDFAGSFSCDDADFTTIIERDNRHQWQQPGDIKPFQASNFDRGFTSSDLFDAKFLRFRNLLISYQLPAVKGIYSSGKVFVQGQNLRVWSPWRGLDPEDNNNISLNEYPNPSIFTMGIDINF